MNTKLKDTNTDLKDRSGFFKKIGPDIARQMTQTLQKLTAEKIKVEFNSVQTFEQNAISVDMPEKCFGSYLSFKSPIETPVFDGDKFEGIVLAAFPVSSAKVLTSVLLKRYLKKAKMEKIDNKLKLSAFKEAVSILIMTYIAQVANALNVKLQMGVPKFTRFREVELSKPALLRKDLSKDSLVSVGQFNITTCENRGCGGQRQFAELSTSSIKGSFIVVY